MARTSLLETARTRTVLGDGAMGTELQRAGLEAGGCGELWNLDHPHRVLEIHGRYVDAGAEFVLTNTFGANRLRLALHGAADRVTEINLAGAALARRAAGRARWVLGDAGPLGAFLEPLGEISPDQAYAVFLDQARALVAGRVDGIAVETMSALDELALAVRAARAAGAPFVLASLSFDATRGGLRTMMGIAPETAARAALTAGADAIGANCGTGLSVADYAEIARRYRTVAPDALVVVRPNAGRPALVGGTVLYDADPDAMAAGVPALVAAGASVIGGCCGVGPDHIRAFARALGASG